MWHVIALFLGLDEEMQRINLSPRVAVGASNPVGQRVVGFLICPQVVDGSLDVVLQICLVVVIHLNEIVEIKLRERLRGDLFEASVRIRHQIVEAAEEVDR